MTMLYIGTGLWPDDIPPMVVDESMQPRAKTLWSRVLPVVAYSVAIVAVVIAWLVLRQLKLGLVAELLLRRSLRQM